MKCWIFFITISFINLCSYGCRINSSIIGNKGCPSEDCVTPDQCDYVNFVQKCGPYKICCSVVKQEYRTVCRQHGGECVSHFCNPRLIRNVTDCRTGTHCCVLVS